jgi:translation initiation factor 2 beta subunit (eIF-2beta)/eIF-5
MFKENKVKNDNLFNKFKLLDTVPYNPKGFFDYLQEKNAESFTKSDTKIVYLPYICKEKCKSLIGFYRKTFVICRTCTDRKLFFISDTSIKIYEN